MGKGKREKGKREGRKYNTKYLAHSPMLQALAWCYDAIVRSASVSQHAGAIGAFLGRCESRTHERCKNSNIETICLLFATCKMSSSCGVAKSCIDRSEDDAHLDALQEWLQTNGRSSPVYMPHRSFSRQDCFHWVKKCDSPSDLNDILKIIEERRKVLQAMERLRRERPRTKRNKKNKKKPSSSWSSSSYDDPLW